MGYGTRDIAEELDIGYFGDADTDMGGMGMQTDARRARKRRKRKRMHRRIKYRYAKKSSRRSGKVFTTKNGQPYIKLADGRARFIKKRR